MSEIANWLGNILTEDLRFVLLALPLAVIAGLWIRRMNEGGMR